MDGSSQNKKGSMPVIYFLRNACEEKYPAIACINWAKNSQMFWWTLRGGNDVFEFANNKNVLLVYLTEVIKKVMIIYLTFAWTSTQGAFLPWYKIWTRVTGKAAFAPSYPSSQSVLLSNDRAPNSTFETVSTTVYVD